VHCRQDFGVGAIKATQPHQRPGLIKLASPYRDFLRARVLVAGHDQALFARQRVIVAHVIHHHALRIETRDE